MSKMTETMKKYRRLIPQLAILTITAATLITGFVIMAFNSTFSWFSNNLQVNGRGMDVTVNKIDAKAEYTVYIFDAKLNDVRYTDDERSPAGSDPKLENLKMQIHDVVFKSRNRYTPAIVHIHLYNIAEEYRQNGSVSLKLVRNGDAAYETGEGEKKTLPKKTTSILRFTLANNTGASWLNTTAATDDLKATATYNNVDNALYEMIVTNTTYTSTGTINLDSDVFTTVTTSGDEISYITKASYITLTVNYTSAQVASGELDLFLYISYDQNLVDVFETAVELDAGGTTIGQISTLTNDLTDLIISFNGN